MKILIAEDEPKTGNYLRRGLSEAGYVVDLVDNGPDGLHLAMNGGYDLVILDVMLPGMDGWQVLRNLRTGGHETPVLFLTARDHVEDRVKGLELGADDYLVKPFSFSELLARVRTILRRGSKSTEVTILKAADLELDLLRRRVTRAGKRIDLTAKEFGLLELLLRRQGEVLPRSLIASQVCEPRWTTLSSPSCCRRYAAWVTCLNHPSAIPDAPAHPHHPPHRPLHAELCPGIAGFRLDHHERHRATL